jgi:hypothetical protein
MSQCILQELMVQCHSLEDMLPGYAVLARSESHTWCRFLRDSFAFCLANNFR